LSSQYIISSMAPGKKSADIVIVGGGVIGLAVARDLAVRGAGDILLLERAAAIGMEASFAAAGMIAPQVEADEPDEFFSLACASRDLYPTLARALQEETGIDVQLDATGTLYLAFTSADEESIERRFEWQSRAGLAIERITPDEVRALEPCISNNVVAALKFPFDIQVENRLLVKALAESCRQRSVCLVTDTTVQSLKSSAGKVVGVETSRGFVATNNVILAGGAWTSILHGLPDIRIEPVKGQMLCFRSESKIANHVIYSPRGYLVPRRDGRLLAGSTTELAGYNKAVSSASMQAIRSNALEISPQIQGLRMLDSWAGLRPRAADNLPVLGPCAEIEGLVYATGHYRNGILLAPLTGELISSAIIDGVLPPLLNAFSADRFGLVPSNARC
jgi:glycine oxidase